MHDQMRVAFLLGILTLGLVLPSHAQLDGNPEYRLLQQMRANCVRLSSTGNHDEALQVRRRIIERFGDTPEFRRPCAATQSEIAVYYEDRGQTDKAMAEYAILVDKYPKEEPSAEASWKLALHSQSAGKPDLVRKYLRNIVESHPKAEPADRISYLPSLADKTDLWHALLDVLPAGSADSLPLRRKVGITLQDAGAYESSVREFTALVKAADEAAKPDLVAEGLWRRSLCYLDLMRYENAGTDLQTIFDKYPKCFLMDEARKLYALVLLHESGPDKAVEYLREIESDEESYSPYLRGHALLTIGRIQGDHGDPEEAVRTFDQCSQKYPEQALTAAHCKCRLLADSGKSDEAVKVQQEISKSDPVRGLLAQGYIERAKGNDREAYKHFREAARAAKDDGLRGEALLGQYLSSLAVGDTRAAEKLRPDLLSAAPGLARRSTIQLPWE